jgi:hypothetical protein
VPPPQSPMPWVPGALSLGVKRPGHEADYIKNSILGGACMMNGVNMEYTSPVGEITQWHSAGLRTG